MSDLKFTGFGGIALAADSFGDEDAPAVLLLHAGTHTRAMWTDVAEELARAGRRVINLDQRGHGESERPQDGRYDFDAYVADLRMVLGAMASRPVIVAASVSGWVALAALEEDGANLATGLVVVDALPLLDEQGAAALGEKLRAQTGQAGHGSDRLDWDPAFLKDMDLNMVQKRVMRAAPTLKLPLLFIRGADSKLTSHGAAEKFVDLLPDNEFVEIEGAGHMVAADKPEEFNGVLLDFLERRVPRVTPEFRAGSDARTLRDALGCFATGVTIVTTYDADGQPVGLTANSFTSVSLDPPLLLVCIANGASSLPALRDNPNFAVNVLQIGQQPASDRFARRGEDRFGETLWTHGEFGSPVLSGSLTSFECKRHEMHDGGDHVILVGQVLKAQFEPRRDPLLYFRGKYRRLHFT